jgi:hypothetical protein
MPIPTENAERYQFAIPCEWEAALREAAAEAATESATSPTEYSIEERDPKTAASELGFHPAVIKAGVWLGMLIVGQVAKKLIEPMIEKFMKKIRSLKKPPVAKPILILLPNGDVEELDPFDEAAVKELLHRLQSI